MKFTSSSQTWSRGITAVQNAVGSPISNPIVENIHVICEEDRVRFTATNLNLTIRCEGEASIEEPGQIVLPSKLIVGIVRDLPKDQTFFFEAKDEMVKIKCGAFNAKLKGQSGDLFPPFVTVEEGKELLLEAEILKDIIRKTIFATSQEKSRYELDGVKFDLKDKNLRCVSTDGRRLAQFSLTKETFPEGEISALVPTKTLQEAQNALPDEGEVHVRFQERKVQISCGDTTIISNLLSDNFPLYERIIPPEGNVRAYFDRQEFAATVKLSANLCNIETNMVIVHFEPGKVEVLAEREDVGGQGQDYIVAEYEGPVIDARYNFKFLQDVFRVMDEEKIEVDIKDARKPGVIRGVGNDSFLYVLMPMRPPDETNE